MKRILTATAAILIAAPAFAGNPFCERIDKNGYFTFARGCPEASSMGDHDRTRPEPSSGGDTDPEPDCGGTARQEPEARDRDRANASMNSGEQRGPNHGDNGNGHGRGRS